MNKLKGFSYIEILIALLLISGTSLALLTQQWHLSQALNQSLRESLALIEVANHKELTLKP
ncbi:MAG: hypothetical protein H0U70_04975 [Tatlockia sp.]|nr:hypothetical protein [Tatlockia sp.]